MSKVLAFHWGEAADRMRPTQAAILQAAGYLAHRKQRPSGRILP